MRCSQIQYLGFKEAFKEQTSGHSPCTMRNKTQMWNPAALLAPLKSVFKKIKYISK